MLLIVRTIMAHTIACGAFCCDAVRRLLLCVTRSASGSNLPNYPIPGIRSSNLLSDRAGAGITPLE